VSAAPETQADPLAPIREIFVRHGGKLPRQPHERELADVAYLITLVRSAPVEITHGESHKALRRAIRTILAEAPGMIAAAQDEAAAAHREGRTTDMDHFAHRCGALLAAAEPFRAVSVMSVGAAAKRDRRGAWHGWGRLMAQEVRYIFHRCGARDVVLFSHKKAPGVLIMIDLLCEAGVHVGADGVIEMMEGR
jgi:hypothetical protein